MARNRKKAGARGEAAAAEFLQTKGYRIVDSNVRPEGGLARGEIDLIAWHGTYLVFIEVKTRAAFRSGQGTPAEAINLRKRRQLVSLAEAYLAKHDIDHVDCRFDLVEVIEDGQDLFQISLYPNAFSAMDLF